MFERNLNLPLQPLIIIAKVLDICLLNLISMFHHISSNTVLCTDTNPCDLVFISFAEQQEFQYVSPNHNVFMVTRNGQSGNTGRLNRNLYAMLKFTERPRTPSMTSKKALVSLKEQAVCRWFRANLNETNADMVQFTKRWNQKWIV